MLLKCRPAKNQFGLGDLISGTVLGRDCLQNMKPHTLTDLKIRLYYQSIKVKPVSQNYQYCLFPLKFTPTFQI